MERTTARGERPLPEPEPAPEPEPNEPAQSAPPVPADAPDDGKVPMFVWIAGGVAVLLLVIVVVMNLPS